MSISHGAPRVRARCETEPSFLSRIRASAQRGRAALDRIKARQQATDHKVKALEDTLAGRVDITTVGQRMRGDYVYRGR